MDSARQVLRWSIPGLVFALEMAIFQIVWRIFEGESPAQLISQVGAAGIVLTALAGIPLGFLIYQFYYFQYGPIVRIFQYAFRLVSIWHKVLALIIPTHVIPGRRVIVRRDRGAEILRILAESGGAKPWVRKVAEITGPRDSEIAPVVANLAFLFPRATRRVPVLKVFKVLVLADHSSSCGNNARQPDSCFECADRYADLFRYNWARLMACLDYVAGFSRGCPIKYEYSSGSDIYHSLGASKTSIMSAAWLSSACNVALHSASFLWIYPVAISLILTAGLTQYVVLHICRANLLNNLDRRIAYDLAWFSRLSKSELS